MKQVDLFRPDPKPIFDVKLLPSSRWAVYNVWSGTVRCDFLREEAARLFCKELNGGNA